MKNKKIILSILALVAVIAVFAGVYLATRPETVDGEKAITVTVVHKDGSEKNFTYHTDEEYLGAVLTGEKLVAGDTSEFGLYIHTVDGEKADYNADQGWWAVYVGSEMATTGIDAIPVHDGDAFKLVYTVG